MKIIFGIVAFVVLVFAGISGLSKGDSNSLYFLLCTAGAVGGYFTLVGLQHNNSPGAKIVKGMAAVCLILLPIPAFYFGLIVGANQ